MNRSKLRDFLGMIAQMKNKVATIATAVILTSNFSRLYLPIHIKFSKGIHFQTSPKSIILPFVNPDVVDGYPLNRNHANQNSYRHRPPLLHPPTNTNTKAVSTVPRPSAKTYTVVSGDTLINIVNLEHAFYLVN